jgi:hypothetical protein
MSRKSPAKLREAQARRNVGRERDRHRREHWGEPTETYCACGKVSARSEKEAIALALHYFARKGGEAPRRAYPCNHQDALPSVWHWTRLA